MPTTDITLPVDLELRVESGRDDVTVLHCKGQITAGETSRAFRSEVVDLLPRHHKIIVDLSGIHSLDRSGLEVLVSLYSLARTAKTTLNYRNLKTQLTDSHPHTNRFHKAAS
jgi:anti-anti-sigma factor